MRQSWDEPAIKFTACALIVLSLCAACASGYITISPEVPLQYEKIGHVEGTACGTLLFAIEPDLSFVPVMMNSRVERAYQAALERAPGARSLTSVSIQKTWYWWVIGTTRCMTITGEAIK